MIRPGLRLAAAAVAAARYEVMPTPTIAEAVVESVPTDVTIAVTASPTRGLDATLELSCQLRGEGYDVVPHVSARLVRDVAHLAEIIARLQEHKITDVFVPAGDADPPAGRFDSSLSLLEALHTLRAVEGLELPRVGITGYPESHPKIGDDITIQAMWDKRKYASYVVSNLCFDARALSAWVRRVRSRGVTLPLRIGLAGPVEATKLVSMAKKAGVTDAASFIRSHGAWIVRLGAPGGYDPDRLLARLGPMLGDSASIVEGLHVFTFNQVRETEQWRRQLLERLAGSGRSVR
jgi:methylenetetrahydrofolate reductase (NADPH)